MMLVIVAGSLPMTVTAADNPDVVKGSNFGLFPGKYTKDGKSFLYTTEGGYEDGLTKFHVYDEDVQLVKEFEPVKYPACECKSYSQRRAYQYEYAEAYYTDWGNMLEINGETEGLSLEQVQSYASDYWGRGVTVLEKNTLRDIILNMAATGPSVGDTMRAATGVRSENGKHPGIMDGRLPLMLIVSVFILNPEVMTDGMISRAVSSVTIITI